RQPPPGRRRADPEGAALVAAAEEELRPREVEGRRDDGDRAPVPSLRELRDRPRLAAGRERLGGEAEHTRPVGLVRPADFTRLPPLRRLLHARDRENGRYTSTDQ